ncbi:MAG TPA: glycosyltransferase family 39 protein [Thermoanaerobaculia bacterium]|nr:glycosyltransferase family 39 protein [Thermoanaerobaculia bacterium]
MRLAIRAALFAAALATGLLVAFLVLRGHDSPWLAAPWILSLFAFAAAADDRPRKDSRSPRRSAGVLLLLFAAALPVLVRVANMDPARMHADEFITGYFSATHDFAHSSFFGSMPEKWEWQGQFPKIYFFVQRAFFTLFGASTLTLRLSVQIYVAIVSVMLFLIVREILDRDAAIVAVVLYSFLSVGLYLETLGLFFIGGTAALTTFLYFALREYRTGAMFYAAASGIACGFCYLMYYSSYIAFPLLLAFLAVHWLRVRRLLVVENLLLALAGMLLVLAPFLAYGMRSGNPVFGRVGQVSLLTGEWSPYREAIAKGKASPISVVFDNLVLSLKSFFRDQVAGSGGFDFGRLAFFDRFSLALLVAGLLAAVALLPRKSEILLVLLGLGASVATVALAIPPPTVHRFSITFPFLIILMTLPFALLLRLRKLSRRARYALAGGFLLLFACANERRFVEAVVRDPAAQELRLSELINQRFDGRNLYVAAFDAFDFQRIFYFRNKWPGRRVETTFHEHLLKRFNRKEKYVYVMILADAFRERFQKADPDGRFYHFSISYSLSAN